MSIRASINNDYYQLIARTAAESGAAAAVRCTKNETLWTQGLELNATDCSGAGKTPANCLDSLRDNCYDLLVEYVGVERSALVKRQYVGVDCNVARRCIDDGPIPPPITYLQVHTGNHLVRCHR